MSNPTLISLFFLFWMVAFPASADVVVVPPDVVKVIAKIEALKGEAPPDVPAKIVENNGRISFLRPDKANFAVWFDSGPAIVRHFEFGQKDDYYAFQMALQDDGMGYRHVVQMVDGVDALFFFNDREVLVYTQTQDTDGNFGLKEWVYALKPNAAHGSAWTWIVKSQPWHWPITINMAPNGEAVVSRHVPIAGIPITEKARSQFMLNMMVAFKKGEPVKKYFPFDEEVVSIPPVHYSTKEGAIRPADIGVDNLSVDDSTKPMPKVGLDLNRWDEHWHTTYKISVQAQENEYPLLIQ